MNTLTIFSTIEAILLVTALSMDAFVASFAYGTNKIKIPFKSVTVINVVCSTILGLALFLGNFVSAFIPSFITTSICFAILLILGLAKLFDSSIKTWLKKSVNATQNVSFKLLDFNFFIRVCADSIEADKDHSKVLTPMESLSLAVALSLDGLAAGFSTGLIGVNYIEIILFSLISDMIAVMLGCFIGNKIAQKTNLNLSWLSGVILILLAFMKL